MKDKTNFFDIIFVFIIPLIVTLTEYFVKAINFQSSYYYMVYYVLGIVLFYMMNMIRKKVFGIYFNTKKES